MQIPLMMYKSVSAAVLKIITSYTSASSTLGTVILTEGTTLRFSQKSVQFEMSILFIYLFFFKWNDNIECQERGNSVKPQGPCYQLMQY